MSSAALIHPTALIDPRARLAENVSVGAYAVIKGPVEIGPGSVILEHVILQGPTRIGRDCRIGPAAYVGMDPQHLMFKPDEAAPTYLIIGDNVVVRESARIHRATRPGEDQATRIGDRCFLMGATHVAHDCVLEPEVTMADGALLGGHVRVGRKAFLGGACAIHQFVRIGRLAVVAGNEALSNDVPPFAAVRYGRLKGYNAVGCRRAGLDAAVIRVIRRCFHLLQTYRVTSVALAEIRGGVADFPEVREIVQFVETSRRGILPAYTARRKTSTPETEADD